MPYTITTTIPSNVYGAGGLREANVAHEIDRRAVATLDEARAAAKRTIEDADDLTQRAMSDFASACERLPEEGGTIGPLPDGTTITVEPMTWRGAPATSEREARAIVDAYNEATS